jgi:hypothetical protein
MRRGEGFYYRNIDKYGYGIINNISRGDANVGSFLDAQNVRVSGGSIKTRDGQQYLDSSVTPVPEVINGLYQYQRQYSGIGGVISVYRAYIFAAEDKLYLWDGEGDPTVWDVTLALAATITSDDIYACMFYDNMYITNGYEIIKTDGTNGGTRLMNNVVDIATPAIPLAFHYIAGANNGYRDYKQRDVKQVGGVVSSKSEFRAKQQCNLLTNQSCELNYTASADPDCTYIELWGTTLYTVIGTPSTDWYLLTTVANASGAIVDNLTDEILKSHYTEDTSAYGMDRWNGLHKLIFYKDRLYGIREDFDPSILWYSDIGYPERWNDNSWVEIRRDDGDYITICGVSRGTLYAFKSRSIWSMTGDPDANPLIQVEVGGDSTPNQTEYGLGCTSPRSLVSFGDTLIFYSKVHGVYKLEGGTIIPISKQVNGKNGILGIDDAVGGIYTDKDGITYYVLTNPALSLTWVCNLSDNSWVTDTNVCPTCFCVDHRGYLLGGKNGLINRYYHPDIRDDNTIEIDKYVKFQWIDLMDNNQIGVPRKLMILGKDMSGFFTVSLYNENDQQPYDAFTARSDEGVYSLLGEPSRLFSCSISWQSGEIESMMLRFLRKVLR